MSDQPGYIAPAAWYVDPVTSQNLRWWSGLEWTEHVAPLPDVIPEPDESDAMPEGETPSSRRAHRQGTSAEATSIAPPPPTPLIAPVTAFDWSHEVDKETPRFARVMEHVDEYRYIPSRWGTVSVWLLASTPWLALLFVVTATLLVGVGAPEYVLYAALALPSLVTLALAQRDHKRLRTWGHRNVAHWAWSFLGPLAYLIARSVVLRSHTGVGTLPLWIWVVNLFAVTVACLLVLIPYGIFLTTQAY